MARIAVATLALGLACLLLGCTTSRLTGPQITKVPAGFGLDLNASGARKVFPDRDVVNERGWFRTQGERHGSVLITEFEGQASEQDLRDARAELERKYTTKHFSYGPIESFKLDGRPAWGWFERQSTSREYVAVVSYPDATFSIEFYSSIKEHQDDELLKKHVASFRRDPGRWSRVFVPVLMIAIIAVIGRFGWRAFQAAQSGR